MCYKSVSVSRFLQKQHSRYFYKGYKDIFTNLTATRWKQILVVNIGLVLVIGPIPIC